MKAAAKEVTSPMARPSPQVTPSEMHATAPDTSFQNSPAVMDFKVLDKTPKVDEDTALRELHEEYYNEDFDSLLHTLQQLPAGFDAHDIEDVVVRHMQMREVLDEKLTGHVMENYTSFVEGMSQVTEIQQEVQMTHIVCKNGRRMMARSADNVESAMEIIKNTKRKHALLEVLRYLEKISALTEVKGKLENGLADQRFAYTLALIEDSQEQLAELAEIGSLKALSASFDEIYAQASQVIESTLGEVCKNFTEEKYMDILEAYLLIGNGDGTELADRTQTCFAQNVLDASYAILNSYVMQELLIADTKKVAYGELCKRLPENLFRPCFSQTMQLLFDQLKSYHIMQAWHARRAGELEEVSNGSLSGDSGSGDVQRQRMMCKVMCSSMERGRKTVWELASRRISTLVESEPYARSGSEQFVDVMEWCNRFIRMGENFSGGEAQLLRAKLLVGSSNYFTACHKKSMATLKIMLDKELWQRLPGSAVRQYQRSQAQLGQLEIGGHSELSTADTFDAWTNLGYNPFDEKSTAWTMKPSNGTSSAEEAADSGNSPSTDTNQVTVTATALGTIRSVHKYIRMMKLLEPCAPDVFKGLSQMFELYMITVFMLFGNKDALVSEMDGFHVSEAQALLTPRLRNSMLRVAKEQGMDKELIQKAREQNKAVSSPTSATKSAFSKTSAALSSAGSSMSAMRKKALGSSGSLTEDMKAGLGENKLATAMLSSGNLYALKERCIAAESLVWLADEIHRLRPQLGALLPLSVSSNVEHFYTRTVDAVGDLREHMYKAVTRLLLNVNGYADKVEKVKWERKEMGMEPSPYVNELLGEFRQFQTKLQCASVTFDVAELMWQYAVEAAGEELLEGFSRVKKCNNEVR
eukprot:scaffold3031_cov393-Prasinococcus_capsulatus_cf.AAC.5